MTVFYCSQQQQQQQYGTTFSWWSSGIHSCKSIVISLMATYMTLVVLLECAVRIFFLKTGLFGLLTDNATSVSHQYPRRNSQMGRKLALLDKRIEGSLRKIEYSCDEEHEKDNDEPCGSCKGGCCDKPGRATTVKAKGETCCSICLEKFQPSDEIVEGVNDCCRSNVFHKACIQEWLRINDSCPCCRQPVLVEEQDDDDGFSELDLAREQHVLHRLYYENGSGGSSGDHRAPHHLFQRGYFRSQFRMRVETATRLRNEILSCFEEEAAASSGR